MYSILLIKTISNMKNLAQNQDINNSNYGFFNHKKMQGRIIEFKPDSNNHYILKLKINNLKPDNYRLVFDRNQLTVILFESIEFNKPVHLHNYKLNDLVEESTYEELKSIDFTMPEDNFYLIGHKVITNSGLLKVVFGKLYSN